MKYLRYVPNASHSLSGSDALVTVKACYQAVLAAAALPQFSWTLESSNTLRVATGDLPSDLPAAVRLWQALNPNARDFRLATFGAQWQSSPLASQGGGVYIATVPVPSQGWRAFFVELTYARGALAPLKLTTQVYVVPDRLPYDYPPAGP